MDIMTIPCLASSESRRTDHFDQNRGNLGTLTFIFQIVLLDSQLRNKIQNFSVDPDEIG